VFPNFAHHKKNLWGKKRKKKERKEGAQYSKNFVRETASHPEPRGLDSLDGGGREKRKKRGKEGRSSKIRKNDNPRPTAHPFGAACEGPLEVKQEKKGKKKRKGGKGGGKIHFIAEMPAVLMGKGV